VSDDHTFGCTLSYWVVSHISVIVNCSGNRMSLNHYHSTELLSAVIGVNLKHLIYFSNTHFCLKHDAVLGCYEHCNQPLDLVRSGEFFY
jgi:hypothetical protein